ncbi:protein SPT2 homolog [Ostrea edulis]|uniref:protein SPT2 homolog n=1 Tax=Ostrea edulis TaxID=37623 RepID=UPI0024AF55BF|nr:protein SPT2 homolog [Ostrea edulis]
MDFQNILSLAAQNSNPKQIQKKFSTQLAPPKKEKKEKEVKSDVVKKFIEEKEREKREAEEARERIKRKIQEAQDRKKREKELKLKREKEEEERKRKEEEKRNRFKIPKKGESTATTDKNEIKSSISSSSSPSLFSSSKVKKESSDRKISVVKNSESKKHEIVSKKSQNKDKHSGKVSDKVRCSSSKSKGEVVDPTTVKPTALSSHNRSSHLYDGIEKKVIKNETDIERKRREFEEKRARLMQQMKAKNTDSEKPVVSKKTEKTKSNKDSDKKSENLKKKSKNDKPSEQEKISEKIGLPNNKPGATFGRPDSHKLSMNEKTKSHNSGKKMPPPMGFSDLLKLAQVKSNEPVIIEKVKKNVDRKEPERLMTKEERERFMEEQACKQRKLSVTGKPHSSSGNMNEKPLNKRENDHRNSKHSKEKNSIDKEDRNSPKLKNLLVNGVKGSSSGAGVTSERLPVKRKSEMYSNSKSSSDMISKSTSSSVFNRPTDHLDAKKRRLDSTPMSKGGRSSPSYGKSVNRPNGQSKSRPSGQSENRPSGQSENRPSGQSGNRPSGQSMNRPISQSGNRLNNQSTRPAQKRKAYDSENENVLVCGPPKPEANLNPFDRIYQQIKKKNPKPEVKKRRIESDNEDSEYDEDMEGFITDEGSDLDDYQQNMDYSQHIRQIFGYDKRKYRYESDREIANMESNFAQQMKEEARSARLGLQEDLEDIRREEEELRRKMEKKKR